jgi:chlorobenzene dioxygenase small subunit/benzene/toluene dioxygenase beta subunit
MPFARHPSGVPVDMATGWALQQFLFEEALLLDERRFAQWAELLAEDLRYVAPTRYNRLPRQRALEWGRADEAAHFDDDKAMILMRIRRLETDRAWSEDPPSRTRHLVSNVRARDIGGGAFEVDSSFIVFRGRADEEQEWFAGTRHDLIGTAETAAGFRLHARTILFDQTKLLATNLGIFF